MRFTASQCSHTLISVSATITRKFGEVCHNYQMSLEKLGFPFKVFTLNKNKLKKKTKQKPLRVDSKGSSRTVLLEFTGKIPKQTICKCWQPGGERDGEEEERMP